MTTFQFNLTHRCNLNCPFCYSYHSKENMNQEIMNRAIEFVINKIHLNDKDIPEIISFSGGEAFTGNYQLIPYAVQKIKESCLDYKLHFILQSNLTAVRLYTKKYDDIINSVDEIGTSYDPDRFVNNSYYNIWEENVTYLQEVNKNIEVISVFTKQFLQKYPTLKDYIDDMISRGLFKLEVLRIAENVEGKDIINSKPLNSDVRNWFSNGYEYYKEVQKYYPELIITALKCIEDACNGYFHYDHSRNCQKDWITILPDGRIGQCPLSTYKPFYNLLTKDLNINNYNYVCSREQSIRPECLKCKYYDVCKGDCYLLLWDKTGCATPYKIFDIIKERNKSNE